MLCTMRFLTVHHGLEATSKCLGRSSEIRKHGAGQHNWGDPEHELQWEELAMQDEQRDVEDEERERQVEPELSAVVADSAFFLFVFPSVPTLWLTFPPENVGVSGEGNEEDQADARDPGQKAATKESGGECQLLSVLSLSTR